MTSSDSKLPKRTSLIPTSRGTLPPGSRSGSQPPSAHHSSQPPTARNSVPPTGRTSLPPAPGSRAPGSTTILPARSSLPPGHLHSTQNEHDEHDAEDRKSSFPAAAVERTLERMTGTFGELGRLMGSTLGLPGRAEEGSGPVTTQPPGAPAGIDHLREQWTAPEPGTVRIRVIDVCPERVETSWIDDVDALLATSKPAWVTLRWIDVDGLNAYVVSKLQRAFGFHTLAAEDVLHVPQRPRVDAYTDHLFVVARMFSWRQTAGLVTEQISVFVREGLVVSFQEFDEDVWNPVRDRLQLETSKLRRADASYLAYSLLDAMVDHCFPILERYGEMLDHLEDAALTQDSTHVLQEVHAIKRELTILRKAVWPMREVIAELSREDQMLVSADTRTYLRDVYQHCVQVIDIIETFRELASSLTDLSLSMASNRMNEVMKVLTIISTVFIPITFLAGVYGMNFEYFPELKFKHSYLFFWMFCLTQSGILLWFFRRKGWLGGIGRAR